VESAGYADSTIYFHTWRFKMKTLRASLIMLALAPAVCFATASTSIAPSSAVVQVTCQDTAPLLIDVSQPVDPACRHVEKSLNTLNAMEEAARKPEDEKIFFSIEVENQKRIVHQLLESYDKYDMSVIAKFAVLIVLILLAFKNK
jgi:hypothetical protein